MCRSTAAPRISAGFTNDVQPMTSAVNEVGSGNVENQARNDLPCGPRPSAILRRQTIAI